MRFPLLRASLLLSPLLISIPSFLPAQVVPVGEEQKVAPSQGAQQSTPAVARAADGRFVVVWAQGASLFGRLFAADGSPRSAPFQIALDGTLAVGSNKPAVAMMDDGSFAVVWADQDEAIRAQRFAADGSRRGPERIARPLEAGFVHRRLDVATNGKGGFVVVWEGFEDPLETEIQAWLHRADGQILGPFQVNQAQTFGLQQAPAVAMGPDGELVIVWWNLFEPQGAGDPDEYAIIAQRFAANGQRTGSEVEISPRRETLVPWLDVGKDGAGNWRVLWIESSAGEHVLRSRRFVEAGATLGAILPVGASVRFDDHDWPSLAVRRDGSFFVARTVGNGEVWRDAVGQDFSPEAATRGRTFGLSSSEAAWSQREPAVAVDAGGNLVAVWVSDRLPDPGVFFRLFRDPNVPAPPDPTQLTLQGGRFKASVTWRDFAGGSGVGTAVPLTDDTGAFWFFSATNLELFVKVLDGRTNNGHFWVFYGALSNVEYTLTVRDTVTGAVRTYHNPARSFGSRGDTLAFPGSAGTEAAFWAPAELEARNAAQDCGAGELCLRGGRFRVEVAWRDFQGQTGVGHAYPLTDDTGGFWFFGSTNLELAVKVLDGRANNGHFWVFYGSLTNVELTLRVTDTVTGHQKTYTNPLRQFASVGDTRALPAE